MPDPMVKTFAMQAIAKFGSGAKTALPDMREVASQELDSFNRKFFQRWIEKVEQSGEPSP